MEKKDQYLIFMLDKRRFAVTLSAVKRISLAVEIVPLPEGPDIVMGVVNVKGEILPVVDIRKRFGLPEKEIDIRDHFLITQTKTRKVVMVVDDVEGIESIKQNKQIEKNNILPEIKHVKGVIKFDGDIILIHDIDDFLSLEEDKKINTALKKINRSGEKRKTKKKNVSKST